MTWTLERLQSEYNLTQEDVTKTLKACNLPREQDEYSDEDIETKFKIVRGYFDSNRTDTYTGAADLFMQEHGITQSELEPEPESQPKAKKPARNRKSSNSPLENTSSRTPEDKYIDISFLLSQAKELCGRSISLTEALQILEACGLPDIEEYTQEQCDRFLKACDLIEKHHKSYEEVALHFGLSLDEEESDGMVQDLDEAADLIESNVSAVTDEMMQQRARGQALTDSQRYLSYYLQELKEGQAVQDFWTRLREHAKAQLSGKPQARLKRAEPQTTLTLPPDPNSTNSSFTLENGTTNE